PAPGYPANITIQDANVDCFGFANMHVWTFSSDGGVTDQPLANEDYFTYSCDYVMTGTGQGEGGLRLSPWWAPYTDGLFNCRTTDGEIACFGGRLPFFTFTGAFGLHYVKGTLIHLEMNYRPNGLSQANPATMEYKLTYNGQNYTSGPLTFDQGNPAEDPPHGQWGCLTPAWAGGHMKAFLSQGNPATADVTGDWSNITFTNEKVVTAVVKTTWGHLKTIYR